MMVKPLNAVKGQKGFVAIPIAQRLEARTDYHAPGGCWVYTGTRNKSNGYGQIWHQGRHMLTHRVSYELRIGPIPNGMELDHLCENKGCINPEHLEPVTHQVNSARGSKTNSFPARQLTHCKWGHELSGDNIHWTPKSKRHCRACDRNRTPRRRSQKVQAALAQVRSPEVTG